MTSIQSNSSMHHYECIALCNDISVQRGQFYARSLASSFDCLQCFDAVGWMAGRASHTGLTALCPGLPGWAGTRKVKPIWILLKQEIVSGSGISWAICKSAHRSRQITTPAPHYSVFTGRMPFLPPNQQCQSTEGKSRKGIRPVKTDW